MYRSMLVEQQYLPAHVPEFLSPFVTQHQWDLFLLGNSRICIGQFFVTWEPYTGIWLTNDRHLHGASITAIPADDPMGPHLVRYFTLLPWFRLMVDAPEMLEPWIRTRNGRCIEMLP